MLRSVEKVGGRIRNGMLLMTNTHLLARKCIKYCVQLNEAHISFDSRLCHWG